MFLVPVPWEVPGDGPGCHFPGEIEGFGPVPARIRGANIFMFRLRLKHSWVMCSWSEGIPLQQARPANVSPSFCSCPIPYVMPYCLQAGNWASGPALRPAEGPIAIFSRLDSGRNQVRKPDFRPGSIIAQHRVLQGPQYSASGPRAGIPGPVSGRFWSKS